jgi:hypothetical protein
MLLILHENLALGSNNSGFLSNNSKSITSFTVQLILEGLKAS